MASVATRTVGKAAIERIAGTNPGAFRSFTAAALVGIAAATLTYRLLRSGD
jgi:hypothetical protein